MTVVLFDGALEVDYGFGEALTRRNAEIPDLDKARAGQSNGLLGAGVRGALSLTFGLHSGPEPLRIEWNETEPAVSEEWEEIVEASVHITSKKRHLSAFDVSLELEIPAAGLHRARLCACGMDAARDLENREVDEPAPDRYLLQLWPAPEAPDKVVRQTSSCAAYWHRVARGEDQPKSREQEDLAELATAFLSASDADQVEAMVYILERVISATELSDEPAAARVAERVRRGELLSQHDELSILSGRLHGEAPPVPRSGKVDVHNMAWRRMKAGSTFQAALSQPLHVALAGQYGPTYHARWALDDQWPSTRAHAIRVLAG